MNSYLLIKAVNAQTYDAIMKAVRLRYYSEHPTPLTALVFADDDYARLDSERVPYTEHSLLAVVCREVLQQFNIRSVYAMTRYRRDYTAALAHINRTRVAVQRPLDPAVAGWSDDDVFVEARRLGWS